MLPAQALSVSKVRWMGSCTPDFNERGIVCGRAGCLSAGGVMSCCCSGLGTTALNLLR